MDDKQIKALEYHEFPKPGKTALVSTKPCSTPADLSLAYTPGVAYPCLAIKDNKDTAFRYTNKANLVGVISNGTAVLGLGNIGAVAGKPVMEGKAILFKQFGGVDVFDLEIDEPDPTKFIDIVTALEPTFGGINLEDIKAPDCFLIEEQLKKKMDIPVFHDDQHGMAVVVLAGLLNALELAGKKIEDVKIVFSGAGAAAIACASLLHKLGVKKEKMFMFDSKSLLVKTRTDLNEYKAQFAQETSCSFEAAFVGADVFIGASQADLVTLEMVQSMAAWPVVFALANPDPEISYDKAKRAVPESIIATGRSDFPNQVNNALCFPALFRGALDVRSSEITDNMKIAAAQALARLAREPITEEVRALYGKKTFGQEYIIPVLFDSRILWHVAPAVAEAAMKDGVARKMVDPIEYKEYCKKLLRMRN